MFKNKRTSFLLVAMLVMSLSLSLMAFSPLTIENTSGPGEPGGTGGLGRGNSDNSYLAEALGITVEELEAAVEEARASDGDTDFNEALATALGISTDALDSARDSARQAALDDALANGDITQEEYDFAIARQELREYFDRDAVLAEALGISVSELQAAQDEGKRISDLLEELGLSQEDFQAAVQAGHDAAIAQAVSDGVITQEQADQFSEGGFGSRGGPDGRDGKDGKGGPDGPGGQDGQDGQSGPGGPGNQNDQGGPGGAENNNG